MGRTADLTGFDTGLTVAAWLAGGSVSKPAQITDLAWDILEKL